MRLTQIFKHYHSCLETVLFFIFFNLMDDLSTEADYQIFLAVCYTQIITKELLSFNINYHTNLPMVFNGLDVMNNFVEREKKTGPT